MSEAAPVEPAFLQVNTFTEVTEKPTSAHHNR